MMDRFSGSDDDAEITSYEVRSTLTSMLLFSGIPGSVRALLNQAHEAAWKDTCRGCGEWRNVCTCDDRTEP